LDELDVLVQPDLVERGNAPVHERVEHADSVSGPKELVDDDGADIAGAARHEDVLTREV
jgi:hypothetical protein